MSVQPLLLTALPNRGHDFENHYGATEYAAAKAAGFEVMSLPLFIEDRELAEAKDISRRDVFMRHPARNGAMLLSLVESEGARIMVPDYPGANEWYKIVPEADDAAKWLGGRAVGWLRPDYAYTLSERQDAETRASEIVKRIFGSAENRFVKGSAKSSYITSRVYTGEQAYPRILEEITYGGRGRHEACDVVYSDPVVLSDSPGAKNGKEEYRSLIIGDRSSTTSLSTGTAGDRDYGEVDKFANAFADAFRGSLPHGYSLDTARLETGELAVVELNDIAASGFYADNDHYRFFNDLVEYSERT